MRGSGFGRRGSRLCASSGSVACRWSWTISIARALRTNVLFHTWTLWVLLISSPSSVLPMNWLSATTDVAETSSETPWCALYSKSLPVMMLFEVDMSSQSPVESLLANMLFFTVRPWVRPVLKPAAEGACLKCWLLFLVTRTESSVSLSA